MPRSNLPPPIAEETYPRIQDWFAACRAEISALGATSADGAALATTTPAAPATITPATLSSTPAALATTTPAAPATTSPELSPTPDTVPLLNTPLRVPSLVPGRWVYLRTWTVWRQDNNSLAGYRSHAGLIWGAYAAPGQAGIRWTEGLVERTLTPTPPTFAAAANALDAYLLSLGAEPVPEGEWPEYCNGPGFHPDRVPYDPADARQLQIEPDTNDHTRRLVP